MSIMGCNCQRDCTLWALIASVIIGIVAAFLQITAVITVAPVALIVAFGIAVVFLGAVLYVSTRVSRESIQGCFCNAISAILAGILGTILTAAILLAVSFAATSVIGAIIVGVLAAAFSLIVTATACLVKCLTNCNG